ncbi:MAG: ATP-grasp domain-containing protein [Thermodesulfobacteriota bacterium]|nr:ATP-grasp domain-containing protein [Thermodesulfobacteriota bacterium]
MKKLSILILYTLPSPLFPDGTPDLIGQESVRSRLRSVQQALRSLGYSVKTLKADDQLPSLLEKILSTRADLIFNLCEEFFGQTRLEMNLAALLELLDIPFTGSPALVLALSQDKGKTKSIFAHYNIPTPPFRVWQPGEKESLDGLRFPLIVKPLREDASLGIDNDAFVEDEKSLSRQVQKIYHGYKQSVLVEEYIDGRELNVSILGNDHPQVLPISEIDFSSMPPGLPRICGYSAKWVEGSQEFCHTVPRCPALLSPEIEKEIFRISLKVYQVMECRDYARVDIRLSRDGIPYVLEVNANPDISPDAGMVRSARAAGFTYPEFLGRIVDLAQARSHSAQPRRRPRVAYPEREPRA